MSLTWDERWGEAEFYPERAVGSSFQLLDLNIFTEPVPAALTKPLDTSKLCILYIYALFLSER